MIGTFSAQPNARTVREQEPALLGLPCWDFQALLSPDSLDTLVIHNPASSCPLHLSDLAIAKTPMPARKFDNIGCQACFVFRRAIRDGRHLFPFGDRLLINAIALCLRPQAFLTKLNSSTHRPCRSGALVKNLSYSASFHSEDKIAPSKNLESNTSQSVELQNFH